MIDVRCRCRISGIDDHRPRHGRDVELQCIGIGWPATAQDRRRRHEMIGNRDVGRRRRPIDPIGACGCLQGRGQRHRITPNFAGQVRRQRRGIQRISNTINQIIDGPRHAVRRGITRQNHRRSNGGIAIPNANRICADRRRRGWSVRAIGKKLEMSNGPGLTGRNDEIVR